MPPLISGALTRRCDAYTSRRDFGHRTARTADFALHGHVHRRGEHGRHRRLHQPRVSSRRIAVGLRHHGAVAGRRRLRAVRRAVLRRTRRGAAAFGRRVSFPLAHLSSGGRLSRWLAFGHGRFCGAHRRGGDGVWQILRPRLAGRESAGAFARCRRRGRGGASAAASGSAACFRMWSRLFKVLLILGLIGAGAGDGRRRSRFRLRPRRGDPALIASAPFAISLVYVMYSYSGWNAVGLHRRRSARARPQSPALARVRHAFVVVLYLALNAIFLRSAPLTELGAAKRRSRPRRGRAHLRIRTARTLMAGLISFGLVSSISAMTWIGPRVAMTMGEDCRPLALPRREDARRRAGGRARAPARRRHPAAAHRHVRQGGELHPVQPHRLLLPHRPRRHRAARARAGSCRGLIETWGYPDHSPALPRASACG